MNTPTSKNYGSIGYNGNWYSTWGERMRSLWGSTGSIESPGSDADGGYDSETNLYGSDNEIGGGHLNNDLPSYSDEDFFCGRRFNTRKHNEELQELLSHDNTRGTGSLALVPYGGGGPTGHYVESGKVGSQDGSGNESTSIGGRFFGPSSRIRMWHARRNEAKKSTCYRCQTSVLWVSNNGWCYKCVERMRLKEEV